MKIKSLGFKVSLIVAVLIVAIIAVVAYIVSVQSDDLVLSLAMKEARASNLALAKELQSLQRDAQARADSISRSYEVITAIQENDMGTLKSALDLLGDDMDVITVCDTKGTVILRAHSDAKGDNVAHLQEIEVALRTGTGMGTIGKGTVANLETSGSAAVTDFSGKIIGVVSCGHDLSNFSYVDDIKDYSSCEATIFDGDMRLSTTLIDEKGNRVIGTRASDYVVETVIRQRNDYSLQIMLFGKYYFAYYSPLVVDNEVIGMLFTGVEIDDALASQHTMLNAVLMTSAICGVLGIALVFVFNTYAVSRPLKRIGSFAEKIRTGDLGIASSSASTIEVHSVDEVGVLARTLEQAYMQLRGYVGEISDRMHDLADGDLATESEYVFDGDFLQIKEAINGIIHNLNQTMTEVNNASFQVSSGSKQVADGAQSLAQGSTEQAASIQELSASIADIAEKTKANADMAVNASKLSDTIRSDAEAGSQQMDDMIAAV
ncbi:MAG: cache domain-containing protein, partial [Clostridiales bacterium]|nr:cache domain-containing protein [Clostridiales bacterium]